MGTSHIPRWFSYTKGSFISARLTCCSIVCGWMKVTKSIEKYPSTSLDLQASPIFKHSELRTAGSTEHCGTVVPDDCKGPSAWIWSPDETIRISPIGSISISTVRLVMFSEGGKASITPPREKCICCQTNHRTHKPVFSESHRIQPPGTYCVQTSLQIVLE